MTKPTQRTGGPARLQRIAGLALAAHLLLGTPIRAQEAAPQPPAPAAEAAPPVDPQVAAWNAALEGAEPMYGLLRLWRKPDQLLLELAPEHLEHAYLMFPAIKTGIGMGVLVSGMDIFADWMIAFRRQGSKIELLRLNTRFFSSSDPQLGWVVQEGYGDSVAAVLPVVAENPQTGSVLVDLAGAFFQDLPDLTGVLRWHFPVPYVLDPNRSAWGPVKVFPLNVELDVQHTFMTGEYFDLGSVPDSRALPLTVRYSIVEPPDPAAYSPRLADDRIGYDITAMKDLSQPGSDDGFVRDITRWNVQKANPAAERSAPREPIVVYLDKSIPYEFRPAVRRGILEWNRAFEAIGIVDAIEVRFQPDDADWDAEDVRYSTVRWSTSFAFSGFGPIRYDPRTGQIFDADILINSEALRGFSSEWRLHGVEGSTEASGTGGHGDAASREDQGTKRRTGRPATPFWGHPRPGVPASEPTLPSTAAPRPRGPTPSSGRQPCTLGQAFGAQVGLGLLALELGGRAAAGGTAPTELIESAVKELVMHEFGHALGLMHNFKGSTATPMDKLHDPAYTREHGLSGSVMDYLVINIAPPAQTQGEYFPSTIGPYDRWAIEYGYRPFPAAQGPLDEADELAAIAARSAEPALAYAGDEAVYGLAYADADPYARPFDLGSEPLIWAGQQIELVRAYLDERLLDRMLAPGERFQLARHGVLALFLRYALATEIAASYVGGIEVRRVHKGQSPQTNYLTPIGAELQRSALATLGGEAFADRGLLLSPQLLGSLPPETWQHWGVEPLDTGSTDFPLTQLVGLIRTAVLDRLFSPTVLQRVQNSELLFAAEAERFTLAELLRRLTELVWAELEADVPVPDGEAVSRFRRDLQRRHLDRLVRLALAPLPGTPQDAVSLARLELAELRKLLEGALSGNSLGPLTEAHLRESLRRIERAFGARAEAPLP